jgi:polyphosphate kinase
MVAPRSLRSGLIDLIEQEIARHEESGDRSIAFKVNSIVDEGIIDALYRASQAGVPVQLWVRGICALRPGVPGLSETIEVRSVLGRFLEHSRIFAFGGGGDPAVYIGSADMMHRNLDRRVEALVRLTDPRHLTDVQNLMALGASDDYAHWRLGPDGRWTRVTTTEDGQPLGDLQAALIAMHEKRRRKARRR